MTIVQSPSYKCNCCSCEEEIESGSGIHLWWIEYHIHYCPLCISGDDNCCSEKDKCLADEVREK